MEDNNLLNNLCRALVHIARITGGYAMVLERSGKAVKAVNSAGKDVPGPEAARLADYLAGYQAEPGTVGYEPVRGSRAWLLPLGEYVLAALDNERLTRDRELEKNIEESLPFIAMVAGGEAVMFDVNGLRLASFGPDGYLSRGAGEYTALGKEAMQKRRAVFGPSLLEKGAQAVRIPITDKFGIGFNNVMAVRQKKKIIESAAANPWQRRYTFDDIVSRSPVRRIGEEATWYLERYNWPGNVRELQNCLERSMNLCDRETIMPEHLPVLIREYVDQKHHEKESVPEQTMRRDGESLGGTTRDAEKRAIEEALRNNGQNRREAAASLGISTVTLWRKMKRYGMV